MNRKNIEYYTGCQLGGAVGDALGAPIEFMALTEIRQKFGQTGVSDYAKAYGRTGAITDDTQMTLFTASGLLRTFCRGTLRGLSTYKGMTLRSYYQWLKTQGETSHNSMFEEETFSPPKGWLMGVKGLFHRRAPGSTCLSALKYGKMGTVEEPINDSKGCGGVMRAAPVGLHCEDLASAFRVGCEIAALTHGHPTGYLAAGCLAAIIQQIISGLSVEASVNQALIELQQHPGNEECSSAIAFAIRRTKDSKPSPEVVETIGQGWVAEEALGISIHCALVSQDDFSKGVLLAVNHGGDSDSTGAITGNILGAVLGRKAIPAKWVEGLELREVIEKVASDLLVKFRDDDEWWTSYPGY